MLGLQLVSTVPKWPKKSDDDCLKCDWVQGGVESLIHPLIRFCFSIWIHNLWPTNAHLWDRSAGSHENTAELGAHCGDLQYQRDIFEPSGRGRTLTCYKRMKRCSTRYTIIWWMTSRDPQQVSVVLSNWQKSHVLMFIFFLSSKWGLIYFNNWL